MKRGLFIFLFIAVAFMHFVSAESSIDSEIKKLTYYAQEYESGNIDYVRLLMYAGTIRENLNEVLGIVNREYGGILNEEQVKKALGEPNEETKWVWVEKEEREKKLENSVPAWNKIIFDGKKIQIKLNSYPSIYPGRDNDFEDKIIYRLHFEINFKKPQEQIDINSKINSIKTLAEKYNEDKSRENLEILARESVNAEKAFESYFRQGALMCEDTMNSLFGSENKRREEKMVVQEIDFVSGRDYDVIARLEMCEECNWQWIGLNMWVNARGRNIDNEGNRDYQQLKEEFKHYSFEEIKTEIKNSLDKTKEYFVSEQFDSAYDELNKINALNDVWNEKSNNVWDEVNKMYESQQDYRGDDRYFWIKLEQEKNDKVKEFMKKNYEERKSFYQLYFVEHIIKEKYYEQVHWEKRLIENFREKGEEICDNNVDDNNNGLIDCNEDQCSGKFAGLSKKQTEINGSIIEESIELYCTEGERKEKDIIVGKEPVCGNHICELGEEESCSQDCTLCKKHEPIKCNGKVIFKGKDVKGCFLEPFCLEAQACQTDSDCTFRCGVGICVENACKLKELNECEEYECVDGEQKFYQCNNGDQMISEICENGAWRVTGLECESKEVVEEVINETLPEQEEVVNETESDKVVNETIIEEEEISGNQCVTKSDCGNENDVCSNGFCVSIPETLEEDLEDETNIEIEEDKTEIEDKISENEELTEENSGEISEDEEQEEVKELEENEINSSFSGNAILKFFGVLINPSISGNIITGFDVQENQNEEDVDNIQQEDQNGDEEDKDDETENEESDESREERIQKEDSEREEERRQREEREENERRQMEKEEREGRCREDCNRQCEEIVVACVEECVFNENGERGNFESCVGSCKEKKEEEVNSCTNQCFESCTTGEEYGVEVERKEHKEQESVFNVEGMCRTSKGEKEGFINFNAWGGHFENFHVVKNKYYRGDGDWCKWELENLVKQRKEFEKGFNQEFAKWFFEQYLAYSADKWENHVSGIYELYWENVNNQREIAFRLNCLRKDRIEYPFQLLNFSYESEFGSIEYWEEIQKVKLESLEQEVEIITPFMRVWIFPNKEFIKSELKNAMVEQRFPGPPEEKLERQNEEGPTEEEKKMLKEDEKFMDMIRKISKDYDDGLDAVLQLKDNDETVFNVFLKVNEDDIFVMKPMTPEETPSHDVVIEFDFEQIYNIINTVEKDMNGKRLESPPWAKRESQPKIQEFVMGVKMYFKVRGLINDARVYPQEKEKDIKKIAKKFLNLMIFSDKGKPGEEGYSRDEGGGEKGEEFFESKEKITGEVIG